ncbi:hypothetical protein CBF87_03175 [Limosilactobacillus reuteri]|uniref:hypothetical protein n=1 Tax=Limosilactobacillus reuteri TaxID=1598 RepID=UPI000B98E654|nr:hypothetical protein [Limosilactobacillus reuteri]OYS47868.1 hypothetical protein CBF87_03175 [Limosilactobacillus reuteri]OYS53648.1 hypothetical protein CBF81_04210 [Limosilactobacillus reuteri]
MNLVLKNTNCLDGYKIKPLSISARTSRTEYNNKEDVDLYPQRVSFVVEETPDGRNVGQRFSMFLVNTDGIQLQESFILGKNARVKEPKITLWARNSFVNITIRAKGVDFD